MKAVEYVIQRLALEAKMFPKGFCCRIDCADLDKSAEALAGYFCVIGFDAQAYDSRLDVSVYDKEDFERIKELLLELVEIAQRMS